jgi:hypothetical protein
MAETFTRQQLHHLVWSAPMRDVSKQFGMSDVGLRKNCMKLFVPPPPQGYWNKVKAGHTVKVIPLPPRPPGISDEISFGRDDHRNWQEHLLANEPVAPVFSEAIETLRERVARNIGIVAAAKNLTTPHIAFRRAVEDDARRRLARSAWDPPLLDAPLEQRRLRILQGLFYGLARLDCDCSAQGKDVRGISVSVGHQVVRLKLDRMPVSRQRGRINQAAVYAERLKLTIFRGTYNETERLSWHDEEDNPLEKHLSEIAAEIIVAGELEYREKLQWRYDAQTKQREELKQTAIRKKLEAEQTERERLLKLEAERVRRLVESSEDHRRANDIRGFVARVVSMPGEKAGPHRVRQWQDWALAQADRIDPLTTGSIWDAVNDAE